MNASQRCRRAMIAGWLIAALGASGGGGSDADGSAPASPSSPSPVCDWVLDIALANLPDAYRDAFLHRHAVDAALQFDTTLLLTARR